MINLDDILSVTVLETLKKYNGTNPYILKLQNEYIKNGKIILTEKQQQYINDNQSTEPIIIDKVVRITPYLGEQLQTQNNLKFKPEKILIETILADTEKTYHILGKLKQNQRESSMYFLPKTQVLDDPYFEAINIDVDFEKYNKVLAKSGKKLYKHQEEGIKFLLSRDGCILADEQGLGKTTQAILAALETKCENILIVCPASLKINWQREIEVFCKSVHIVDGKNIGKSKFTIINYDILKSYHTVVDPKAKIDENEIKVAPNRQLVNKKFDLIICDEAHYLQNNNSKRGDIILDLATKFNDCKVWLLTGTPVTNGPKNLYNLLKIIKSKIADNWHFYTKRYCDAKKIYRTMPNGKKKQIWLIDGASNLEELASKTRNIILRRLKENVLDMPDKIITPVYHELSDKSRDEYNALWDEYLVKRKLEKKRGVVERDLVELILLRKFISMQSIPMTIEMAKNAIEMGDKVIIFTNFTDELNELQEAFDKICVVHNGSMSNAEKQRSVDNFQNNPKIKVFIGNIKSAGVGITLTAANVVIFNSFDWVPGSNEQCEDRSHRIGQNQMVNIYYQLFLDTISTRMWETVHEKKDVIQIIVGDKKLSEEEIITILTEKMIESYE